MWAACGCGLWSKPVIDHYMPLAISHSICSHLKIRPQLRHYDPTTHVLWIQGSQASGCLVITARCRRQGKWLPPPAAASAPISARTSGGRGCGRREWRTMEVPPSPPPSPSATALPLRLRLLLLPPLPSSTADIAAASVCLVRLLPPPAAPAATATAATVSCC